MKIRQAFLVLLLLAMAGCGRDVAPTSTQDGPATTSAPATTTTSTVLAVKESLAAPATDVSTTTNAPVVDDDDDDVRPASNTPEAIAPTSGEIRDVDFFDGFVYTVRNGGVEELEVQVADGEFTDEEEYIWFWVMDVEYGDLDFDGDEEAVVQTNLNTGGTGQFGGLTVWDIDDGRVVERDFISAGDRAHGGIAHWEIRDGMILMENFQSDRGACCPDALTQQRLALTSQGVHSIQQLPAVRWVATGFDDDEVEFLPGTNGAVIQVAPQVEPSVVTFEAAAGQWVTLARRGGDDVDVRVLDAGGAVIGETPTSGLTLQLPTDGVFDLEFTTGQEDPASSTTIDFSITAAPIDAAPGWTVSFNETLVEVEPPAQLLVATPRFDAAEYAGLNDWIELWMADQTNPWVADLEEFPPLERDDQGLGGAYELLFDVTLESEDLASFRWNWYEYVCCRPHPNHGHRSLVIDLAQQRIVPVDEILDLDRLEEIHTIWVDHADPEFLPPDFVDVTSVTPAFSSIALTPIGVEFGTDRSGPVPGTTTVVPFAALGDLVMSDFVERAKSGFVPTKLS